MKKLNEAEERRAAQLHKDSIVIDTLWGGGGGSGLDPSDGSLYSEEMLIQMKMLIDHEASYAEIVTRMDKLRAEAIIRGQLPQYWDWWQSSGVDVASVTVGLHGRIPFTYDNAVRDLALWQRKFDAIGKLVKITRAKNIVDVEAEGKYGVILNFQNTTHVGADLDILGYFYDLGVRIIQLTYNTRNLVGNGCTERRDDGLSHFGLAMIRRMNDLGILIDLSHCGVQTTLEAVDASAVPVAITHSFCRALSDHDRGKPDHVIEALGRRGGFFGVMIVPWFISADPNPTLEHFLDHVDRVASLIGTDKVGIGTDYGSIPPKPLGELEMREAQHMGWRSEHRYDWAITMKGFQNSKDTPNITRGLVARGYSDTEIRGILGQNFLRIFSEVVG